MKKLPVILLLPCAVLAQFGISIVSDPVAHAHLIEQIAQTIKVIEGAAQLYELTERAYNNLEHAAQYIDHKEFWLPSQVEWSFMESPDAYGTSGLWVAASASGSGGFDGYHAVAIPLRDYTSVWNELPPTSQDQIARHYGSIELADSTAINAINQAGAVRSQAAANELAIARLSDDVYSNDPELNTQVGILNQISAGSVINARQGQNTNQMLAALVDQQTTTATMQRNAMAVSIADDIAARQAAQDNRDSIWNGSTDGRGQRLP